MTPLLPVSPNKLRKVNTYTCLDLDVSHWLLRDLIFKMQFSIDLVLLIGTDQRIFTR